MNKQINNILSDELSVNFSTRVIIEDLESGEVLLDKANAIHSQNMARAIARGLANEDNSIIYRIAFGNGGSFTDAAENIILNPPNDGTGGEGWESRLYQETYSEIVDGPSVGIDPGSVGPANVRLGGGSVPEDDDPANSVHSVEVGRKSNIIAQVTINRNEPITQLAATAGPNTISEPEETTFSFDELGFYTPGRGAAPTPGIARIDVGTRNSDSLIPAAMMGESFSINMTVNGDQLFSTITIPASGSGSGPGGEITFGDLCEGINSGNWITGDSLEDVVVLITNQSTTNTYPSILGAETFGYLVFQTVATGTTASVSIDCSSGSFFEDITGVTDCVGRVEEITGLPVGVLNDPSNTGNERERLLTHITFPPILKKANREIRIRYILTVSVAQVADTILDISNPDV